MGTVSLAGDNEALRRYYDENAWMSSYVFTTADHEGNLWTFGTYDRSSSGPAT